MLEYILGLTNWLFSGIAIGVITSILSRVVSRARLKKQDRAKRDTLLTIKNSPRLRYIHSKLVQASEGLSEGNELKQKTDGLIERIDNAITDEELTKELTELFVFINVRLKILDRDVTKSREQHEQLQEKATQLEEEARQQLGKIQKLKERAEELTEKEKQQLQQAEQNTEELLQGIEKTWKVVNREQEKTEKMVERVKQFIQEIEEREKSGEKEDLQLNGEEGAVFSEIIAGIIALALIGTLIVMVVRSKEVPEILQAVVTTVIGFFFGMKASSGDKTDKEPAEPIDPETTELMKAFIRKIDELAIKND